MKFPKQISLLMFSLMLPGTALALDLIPDFNLFGGDEEQGTMVWEGGDQFVKLVTEEKGAAPNQHPVELAPSQLATVLRTLKLKRETGLFGDEIEQIPLFARSEITILSSALSRALARAKPGEDVIFQLIGMHPGSFAKERMGVAGRVFFKDGRLNIIMGDVHKPISGSVEQHHRNMAAGCGDCPVDRRIDPFRPGKRGKEHKLKETFASVEGMELMSRGGSLRSDWLVLDVPRIIAAIERENNKLPPALVKERAKARAEARQLNLERRQMRAEMARMRKEMKQMSKHGKDARSLEDRLATLQALKQKKLITDAEYQAKRREILNDM